MGTRTSVATSAALPATACDLAKEQTAVPEALTPAVVLTSEDKKDEQELQIKNPLPVHIDEGQFDKWTDCDFILAAPAKGEPHCLFPLPGPCTWDFICWLWKTGKREHLKVDNVQKWMVPHDNPESVLYDKETGIRQLGDMLLTSAVMPQMLELQWPEDAGYSEMFCHPLAKQFLESREGDHYGIHLFPIAKWKDSGCCYSGQTAAGRIVQFQV